MNPILFYLGLKDFFLRGNFSFSVLSVSAAANLSAQALNFSAHAGNGAVATRDAAAQVMNVAAQVVDEGGQHAERRARELNRSRFDPRHVKTKKPLI